MFRWRMGNATLRVLRGKHQTPNNYSPGTHVSSILQIPHTIPSKEIQVMKHKASNTSKLESYQPVTNVDTRRIT